MILFYQGMPSRYEIENVTRLFFLHTEVREGARDKKEEAYCFVRRGRGRLFVGARIGGRLTGRCMPLPAGQDPEFAAAESLFLQLSALTGYTPSWGLLTGVRPVAFLRSLEKREGSTEAAADILRKKYRVSEEKLALAEATAQVQRPVLAASGPRSYSLYVSIPFCPTRCSYCSFVSRTTRAEAVSYTHLFRWRKSRSPPFARRSTHMPAPPSGGCSAPGFPSTPRWSCRP